MAEAFSIFICLSKKNQTLELIINLLHVLSHQFFQISKIISIITNFMMTQNSCFECKPSFQSSFVRKLVLVANILISALEINVKLTEVWKAVSLNCWARLVIKELAEDDAQWAVAPLTGLAPYPSVQWSQAVPEEDCFVPQHQGKSNLVPMLYQPSPSLAADLGTSFCRRGKGERGWFSWQLFQLSDETAISAQRFSSSVQTATALPLCSSILRCSLKQKVFFSCLNQQKSLKATCFFSMLVRSVYEKDINNLHQQYECICYSCCLLLFGAGEACSLTRVLWKGVLCLLGLVSFNTRSVADRRVSQQWRVNCIPV